MANAIPISPSEQVKFPIVPGVRFALVPGFPAYAVGDDGSVWSRLKRNGGKPCVLGNHWSPLKQVADKGGYLCLGLHREGKTYRRRVHHLVLEAFVGPRPNGSECCHGDGNRANNRVGNLRWGTKAENDADKTRHDTWLRGARHPQARLTEEMVREIREIAAKGRSKPSLASRFGVTKRTITLIVQRKAWSHVQ